MGLKVKFFGSMNPLKTTFSGKEEFFNVIETKINTWLLARPGIEVVEIKQSASGGSFAGSKLMVSVWYRDGSDA